MLLLATLSALFTLAMRASTEGRLRGALAPERHGRIPGVLILTGAVPSMGQLQPAVLANVNRTIGMSPGLEVRWFDDTACEAYIKANYDEALVKIFHSEARGSYRGDICRTAVLAREGGFYIDLDVQLAQGIENLVNESTTFMSVWEGETPGAVLNALIASEPGGVVMVEALSQMRQWYNNASVAQEGWMGPVTLGRAVKAAVEARCPDRVPEVSHHQVEMELLTFGILSDNSVNPEDFTIPADPAANESRLQWECGSTDQFRFYAQSKIMCLGVTPECPERRVTSSFPGLMYGLFEPGPARKIVGWPRFEECAEWGCAAGGLDIKPAV